jgi:hypothetical protein
MLQLCASPDPEVYGLQGADHDWVQRRQTPHPGNTYQAPLEFRRTACGGGAAHVCQLHTARAGDHQTPSRLRAKDPAFWGGAWLPNSRVVEILPPGTTR